MNSTNFPSELKEKIKNDFIYDIEITTNRPDLMSVVGLGREEFRAMLKICEALRDHTKDLIKANTASWASGYAEDAS